MTNFTPIQLEAIRLLGRKDLEFGCILRDKILGNICKYIAENLCIWEGENDADIQHRGFREERFEILGHIPHWHDLFSVLRDKGLESFLGSESLLIDPDEKMGKKKNIEVNKYIPLLDQPSLPEIINLFKND